MGDFIMNEKENWGSNLPPDLKDAEEVECHECGDYFIQETNPDDFVCSSCKNNEDCDESDEPTLLDADYRGHDYGNDW